MKMARLRTSKSEVSREAVENLWRSLLRLWTQEPLAFIELVRHARKRRYEITDESILAILLSYGLIGPGRDFPVHDAMRELIASTVEGDGIRMMLHRPFEDDGKAVSTMVTLRSGDAACLHIVQWAVKQLEALMISDYIAFVELVRYFRGKNLAGMFGDTLFRLLRTRILRFRMRGDEMAQAMHVFMEAVTGGLIIGNCRELICEPVIELVAKNAVIGETGLSFRFQDPVQPRKSAAPVNGQCGRNGHAHTEQPVGAT